MAHGITGTDGVFSVREPMWHKLGTVLEDYPTLAEAKKLVHDWEPVQEPLYRRVPVVHEHTDECWVDDGVAVALACGMEEGLNTQYVEAESVQLNVRSDNGFELGATSREYGLVTNQDLYDIAGALESESKGEVMLETGGSLHGGRKVFLLVRLREPIILDRKAPAERTATIPFYGLQNSHDGSASLRGQGLATRIVCDNTAQMADMEAAANGCEFTFRHGVSIGERIKDAKEALIAWREGITAWQEKQEFLLTLPISPAQRQDFITAFIDMPTGRVVSDRVRQNVQDARNELTNIILGPTGEGVESTAYGLVQGAIEYLNHYRRARSVETRFRRTFLSREKLVVEATSLALEAARG